MLYQQLAGTDLQLSRVGFGCWAIGGQWWGPVVDADSRRAVSHAVELGINWFDTAPLYGHGHADRVLVEALGPRRHDVIIATKVGPISDAAGHAACDLTPANIRRDIEASLARLDLETIPIVQIHWPCERGTPLVDSIGTLEELKGEGKLRYFGLCNYSSDDLALARSHGSVVSLQRAYSMVRRELERERDAIAHEDIGVLVYETLCRGLLTGKFTSRPSFPDSDMRGRDDRFAEPAFSRISTLVQALRILARRLDTTPAAIAIAWTLRDPTTTAAIVGAKTEAQVAENVGAVELLDRKRLWEALEPYVDHCRV